MKNQKAAAWIFNLQKICERTNSKWSAEGSNYKKHECPMYGPVLLRLRLYSAEISVLNVFYYHANEDINLHSYLGITIC